MCKEWLAFRHASERKFPLKSVLNLLQYYNFSYLPIFPSNFVSTTTPYTETLSQACKEGSVINDHLGQRHVCHGGKLINCRVRREWIGMHPGERWV